MIERKTMEQTEGMEADTKERELIERGGRWLKEDYGADRRSGS